MRNKIVSLITLLFLSMGVSGELKTFERDFSQTSRMLAKIYTHEGILVVDLNFNQAPQTVANFEELARRGFYDGVIFHRVIQGFMLQAGDPNGNGTGGPGYNIPDESNSLIHETAVISMANTGKPNSGGSQFFITQQPQPHLNGKHTVFGKVIQGEPFIYLIEKGDPIIRVEIVEEMKAKPEEG